MNKLTRLILAFFTALSFSFASAAVNLNTATEQELQTLPGIGAAKARAIVQYRSEKGPFKTVEDIKQVKGIGEGIFGKLKDQITVSAPAAKSASPAKPTVPAAKP